MKFLVALSVSGYRKELEDFFIKHNVSFLNEFDVTAVNLPGVMHRAGSWFGYGNRPTSSIAFFTFLEDKMADTLMKDLEDCRNERQECHIKAFLLDVEKSIL